jgi:3',5'-cyclic AMP phosphodiesterase CpdA
VSLKLSRRQMLGMGAALLSARGLRASDAQPVDFIHVADTHMVYSPGVHPVLFEARKDFHQTIKTLPGDLAMFHRDGLASFVVHTGDIIDAYSYEAAQGPLITHQIEAIAGMLNGAPLPVYAALGNHDILHYGVHEGKLVQDQSVAGPARASWIRNLSCFRDGTWYSFSRTAGGRLYRFAVLENGFFGGRPSYLPQRKPEFRFGMAQTDWLRNLLTQHPDDPFVLVLHVPPADLLLEELLEALGTRKAPVVMLTGHLHAKDHCLRIETDALPLHHVGTPAYVVDRKHWRRLRLYGDRMEVMRTGSSSDILSTIPLAE